MAWSNVVGSSLTFLHEGLHTVFYCLHGLLILRHLLFEDHDVLEDLTLPLGLSLLALVKKGVKLAGYLCHGSTVTDVAISNTWVTDLTIGLCLELISVRGFGVSDSLRL